MRIYVDLDNVLVNPVVEPRGMVRIHPRPGADRFLSSLARRGEMWLLTASDPFHAKNGLKSLGSAAKTFTGIITREDLAPVEEQLQIVFAADLNEVDRSRLWATIPPIAPRGVVFDDFPVGSEMFLVKSTAVGIGPEQWIQVEPFTSIHPDKNGLGKAYEEFKRRFGLGNKNVLRKAVV
jgi:hypothetical protein